ncbi:hypothetical protein LUZ60_001084 [Juncus effusus]|nr:hypothetical protein LUZ60_001084 [Juncus effusus]
MYADAAWEYGFSPGGFMASEMYGHSFGHYELQQIPTAQSIAGFSSDLADCGTLVGSSMVQPSMVSDYDLGIEGDLFKAPEPIISEPVSLPGFDPVTASAISIISSSSADIIADSIATSSIQTEQLLNDVFYECQKIEECQSFSELLDVKIPPMETVLEAPVEGPVGELKEGEGAMQKSVSSGCLNSTEWGNMRPNFLSFQEMDFETAYGLRRAFSEGDIQNMGSNAMMIGSTSANVNSCFEGLPTINDLKSEERRQKLSRYRKKKIKRNFGRKIKYACRKALADSQPRVRGRFAKIEEREIPRPKK